MGKLILSRKELEEVVIFLPDGRQVIVSLADIERGKARIAFTADSDIKIMRRELLPVALPAEAS